MSPISTNLDQSPYWDDWSSNEELKNYMKVLFKPSVSVQTRELNIVQDMFQAQIEAFGDNIYKDGSVISGCNYQPYNPYPYIKINDLDVFNNLNIPSNFLGYNIINNTTGVSAVIVNFLNGFQTTPPNLKTLYLSYKTGNNTANTFTFNAGDLLTIYNPVTNPIQDVQVANSGIGYSNSDTMIFLSSIAVTVTYGNVSNTNIGDFIFDPTTSANVQIVNVDANTYASANQVILTVAPRSVDLSNVSTTSSNWTVTVGESLRNIGNTYGVMVLTIMGSQAAGNIVTNGVGAILNVNMTAPGTGYFPTIPYVAVKSIGNPNIGSANLIAQNYLTQLNVSSDASAVGNGYAAGVTQGTIFQKGYFLPVAAQQIIVDPYDTSPNGVVMGFTTIENIITSNQDQTLLDNVNNTQNQQAPGADRLQMIPQLVVVSAAAAASNVQFLPYATWNEGLLVLLNETTTFNTVGAQIAQAINDADGDFVTEPFLVTTTSPANTSLEGEYFNVVVDQGIAYINGYKVATVNNYITQDTKGTANAITNNHIVSLNYGNYLVCNNVAGFFQFNTGATVNLQDTAKGWYANVNAALNPAGNTIGNASLRSVQWISGEPGTANAQYGIYLFNINMANGYNFANVGGLCYSPAGANTGLADAVKTVVSANSSVTVGSSNNLVVTQSYTTVINTGSTIVSSPTSQTQGQAIVSDLSPTTLPDTLCFYTGVQSLKNANSIQYQYYTCNSSASCNVGNGAGGNAVASITLGSGAFPWTGNLTNGDMEQLYVVPTSASMTWTTTGNTAGNVASTSTYSGNVSTANTVFLTTFQPGDWVYVAANATSNEIHQIQYITNNNSMVFTSNVTFTNANCLLYRTFPENVPIPFGSRANLAANVVSSTLNLLFETGFTFTGTTELAVYYPVQINPTGAQTKTVNRNQFVVHYTGNSPGGQTGPWSVGVPDAFRLDGVYIGNSSVTNTGTNYISNFYLDTHQKSDYYGISRVYLQPTSGLSINATSYILIQFDYMTTPGVGFYDTLSYVQTSNATTLFTQDSQPLSNLANVLNSFEVPVFFDDNGTQYDLLQQFDFRPYASNTGAPATTYGAAYLNPNTTLSFSGGEQQFPVPGVQFECNLEYWEGRIDSLFVDQNGNFTIAEGNPAPTIGQMNLPIQPQGTMKIVDMQIPPYPNLPTNLGLNIAQILNNGVQYSSAGLTPTRDAAQTIANLSNTSSIPFNQPAVYTMADIGTIDRRLANVEYYITLDTLTASATSLQIPSTANPGSNRFQYGVFVDNFQTSDFSALTSPEYAATYITPNIVPPRMLWDISFPGYGNPSWIPQIIVQQPFATTGSIIDPLGLGPVCALNLANTVAYKLLFRNATDLEVINPNGNVDVVNVTLANTAEITGQVINNNNLAAWLAQAANAPIQNLGGGGSYGAAIQNNPLSWIQAVGIVGASYNPANQTITIITPNPGASENFTDTISGIPPNIAGAFLALLENQITPQQYVAEVSGNPTVQPLSNSYIQTEFTPPVTFYFYNYNEGVEYQIYQNGTLIADTAGVTGNQPVPLSNTDVTLLTGPTADYWFNDNTAAYLTNPAGNTFITGAGKIVFDYNPAKGGNFTIVTTMSPQSYRWRYTLAYPINGAAVGCVPVTAPTVTLTDVLTPIYQNYTIYSVCGNGARASGTIGILVGATAQVSGGIPAPATSIVPFNTSKDWAGAAAQTITTPLIGYAPLT